MNEDSVQDPSGPRQELPLEPPPGMRYSDGYSGPYRRPTRDEKKAQRLPGAAKIMLGVPAFLIALLFATMGVKGAAQGVLVALCVALGGLVAIGLWQFAEHSGRLKERFGRR